MIVATHCVTFFSWSDHTVGLWLMMDLFDNSTLIFMFISGYLFHHTSAKFDYLRFLKVKFLNVILPYSLAAAPGIAYVILRDNTRLQSLPIDRAPDVVKAGYLLLYGGAQVNYALWFIPVICIYYLASPLLLQFVRRPVLYFALLLLIPLSVLMHRPTYNHGHNLGLALYFLSAYVTGMFCSQYQRVVTPYIDRHWVALCAATLALMAGHLLGSNHHGNYSVASLLTFDHSSGWIDWLFVQKTLVTLSLWGITRRLRSARMPALDHIAGVSFTIYFLHLYVIYSLAWLMHDTQVEVDFASFLFVFAIAVLVPSGVAGCVRRFAPKWSRTLVGS